MGTETFSKDTFLTSLLDSEGIKLQQDKFFVPDPEGYAILCSPNARIDMFSMKQVRHQFKDLSRVVASLSDQVSINVNTGKLLQPELLDRRCNGKAGARFSSCISCTYV